MVYLHFFMEEFLKQISFCSVYFGKVCVRICVCVGVGRVVLSNDSYLKPIPLSTFIWCVQSRKKKKSRTEYSIWHEAEGVNKPEERVWIKHGLGFIPPFLCLVLSV